MPNTNVESKTDDNLTPTYLMSTHYLEQNSKSAEGRAQIVSKFSGFYNIANKELLKKNNRPYGLFQSEPQYAYIDQDLGQLKINHQEKLEIHINLIYTQSPDTSLFVKIMADSRMQSASGWFILSGLLALTAALITLIPVIAAIGVSSGALAITGGVILAISITLALINDYCKTQRDKAPIRIDFDATMEQKGNPGSKTSLSAATSQMLCSNFFPTELTPKKPDVNNDEAVSSEFVLA